MNILLWVLQVLLALAFFAHGCLFLFPPAALVDQMNASLPRWFQLFLGIAEILAVGTDAPGCRAHSAVARLLCGCRRHDRDDFATVFHLMRGEVSSAITTLVLLAVATFIAYMRWRVAPILPRRVT